MSGGTSTTTATFTVATVSGGVVLTVTPANTGHYTVKPANPVSTTGGAGTCTLTITWNAGGNGGGFDTGVAGFPTDGAATVANTSAPVFTSASYNFVAGDVGAWIYIKSGTSWTPGWYKIASVASNAATLNGTIGAAVLAAGTPTTVVGCATVASPTSATWGIDYSQGTAGQISFTDMVVAATTTNFTSVAHPVGKNYVGNIINVTSGATVQRVAVVSTSTITATVDKTLGTAAQVGVGTLGGPLGSPGAAGALAISSNQVHIKNGAYSITSASTNVPAGCFAPAAFSNALLAGYQTVRGDFGTAPVLTAGGGISTFTIITLPSNNDSEASSITVDGATLTSSAGFSLNRSQAYKLVALNCTNGGLSNANGVSVLCRATGCSSVVAINTATAVACEAYSNTFSGLQVTRAVFCLAYANSGATSDGIIPNTAGGLVIGCVSYNNGRDGFRATSGSGGHSIICVNCIAESNVAGIGFNRGANSFMALLNCATFGNLTATSTANDPQVIGTITGTGTFFINAAGGNFALNNIGGSGVTQGAACRAAGIPGVFPSGTTTGLQDIGAAQSRVPWQTANLVGGTIG